jgi:hypothetical protein
VLPRETVERVPVPKVVRVVEVRVVVLRVSRALRVVRVVPLLAADVAPDRTIVRLPSSIVTPRAPVVPEPPDSVLRVPPRSRRELSAVALRESVDPRGA